MARLLSKSDVVKVLTMEDTIDILEKAFTDLATGKAEMPQRIPIRSEEYNGLSLFMPAYLKGLGALGSKAVTIYPQNPAEYDLPTVMGTILMLDEKTGKTLSIMDGGYLTAVRTGAVAGLATKFLAREDAEVHTMFGTGGMAKTHAVAVDRARNIEKLILFSKDPIEKRDEFRDLLKSEIKCKIEISDNPEQAVNEADIVTLITSSKDPVIDGNWVREGTHINCNGSHAPAWRELDALTVNRSKVVCDLVDACKSEAGDFIIPIENGEWSWEKVHGSLGDVVAGLIRGRESDNEITLFKSVGLAIQDISTASHVYNKAVEMNIGLDFEF